MFSDLNSLAVYDILDSRYATAFGFTAEEVAALAQQAGASAVLDVLRDWYDGYCFGGHDVYNPWSVLSFLAASDQPPRPYWRYTSSDDLLRQLLAARGPTVAEWETLLSGGEVHHTILPALPLRDLERTADAVWSFLLFSGYLTATSAEFSGADVQASLRIPNREVRGVHESVFAAWLRDPLGSDPEVEALVQSLLLGDAERAARYLTRVQSEQASYHDFLSYAPEAVYHAFLLGLLVRLSGRYRVRSSVESGYGRADVLLIPCKPGEAGAVLELNVVREDQTVESALGEAVDQVTRRDYTAELRAAGASPVRALAIVFDGKRVHARSVDWRGGPHVQSQVAARHHRRWEVRAGVAPGGCLFRVGRCAADRVVQLHGVGGVPRDGGPGGGRVGARRHPAALRGEDAPPRGPDRHGAHGEAAIGGARQCSGPAPRIDAAVRGCLVKERSNPWSAARVLEVLAGLVCGAPWATGVRSAVGRARSLGLQTQTRGPGLGRRRGSLRDDAMSLSAVSPSVLSQAACGGEVVVVLPDGTAQISRAIPAQSRRGVMARDFARCVVPYCRSTVWVDAHHLRPRSEGGTHDPTNLVCLWPGHHRAVHEHILAIYRKGSDGQLVFELPDGSHFSAAEARPTWVSAEELARQDHLVSRVLEIVARRPSHRFLIASDLWEHPRRIQTLLLVMRGAGLVTCDLECRWVATGQAWEPLAA